MPNFQSLPVIDEGRVSKVVAAFEHFQDVITPFPLKYFPDKCWDITTEIGSVNDRKLGFRDDSNEWLFDKLFIMNDIPPMIVLFVV